MHFLTLLLFLLTDFNKPRKCSLKRKRHTIEALLKADEGYEDDIYDKENFSKFQKLLIVTSIILFYFCVILLVLLQNIL